jgi:hypothetical protein
MNGRDICRRNGHVWCQPDRNGARTCANGCGTIRFDYPDGTSKRYFYAPDYLGRMTGHQHYWFSDSARMTTHDGKRAFEQTLTCRGCTDTRVRIFNRRGDTLSDTHPNEPGEVVEN